MRKLPVVALAGALAIAGTAFAASPKSHVMNVPLPDGSVARVEYVGDVAPKVTVEPAPLAAAGAPWATRFPAFPDVRRMIAEMNRRSQEMIRRADEMARHPRSAAPYVAAYGNAPAGETSTTVVSVSNGGKSCTRTTQIVSQGPGKPPKVTSNSTGDCAAPAAPGEPLDRT